MRTKLVLLALVATLSVGLYGGFRLGRETAPRVRTVVDAEQHPLGADPLPRSGTVTRVVDGDTIHVEHAGVRYKVRLIGIDTPEVAGPGAPECYASEASEFLGDAIMGRKVRLRGDREPLDRYGRWLAYVEASEGPQHGRDLSDELVRRGFATTLKIEPNTAHAERLERLERAARNDSLGLWKECSR